MLKNIAQLILVYGYLYFVQWICFWSAVLEMKCCISILQFSLDKRSILALGDITVIIPDDEADIAVLEEPEHLTWYHHGKRWKEKFRLVVGIVHTNYWEIVRRERNIMVALLIKYINGWVIDIYCHKV